ncbi:hypothetical protein SS50377_27484 [Spironucleus salmonicida]|uniref:Uncharacterized protein n=1 Tax=Spironucleus salmonicida TaxID=348837 RepID=V6LQH2_9EUKA|nr:hypothetical protein SS50377_27484 [Spironucleus salmonicida]|eukprot:EST46922.1 Hypothetical protein SS50377_13079 [Spironucleus salmonicida]
MDLVQDHYNSVMMQIGQTEQKINELKNSIKELEETQKLQQNIMSCQQQHIEQIEQKCQRLEKVLAPNSKLNINLEQMERKVVAQQQVLKDYYGFYKMFVNMNDIKIQ